MRMSWPALLQAESSSAPSLIAFFNRRSKEQRHALERAYLEVHGEPLLTSLQRSVKGRTLTAVRLLLAGFDYRRHVKQLRKTPKHLLSLLSEPLDAVLFAVQEYRAAYQQDLSEAVHVFFSESPNDKHFLLCLSLSMAPQIAAAGEILQSKKEIEEEQSEYVLGMLKGSSAEVLAFEAGFNHFFACFKDCYRNQHGSLLQRLRAAANKNFLPRYAFAEAILLLENIDPSVLYQIRCLLAEENVAGKAILTLQNTLRTHRPHLVLLQTAFNILNEQVSLRDEIHELQIPLEIKNKTILLLDGYDPDEVAEEIGRIMLSEAAGEALGQALEKVLGDPRSGTPNRLIPDEPNWIEEMYHQIRVSYQARIGRRLISDLFEKNVPLCGKEGINAFCYKLYGAASKSTMDIRRLLEERRRDGDESGVAERKIVQALADLLPPLRERVMDMYDAFFGIRPGEATLLGEIHNFRNEQVRSKGEELLLEGLSA